MASVRDVEVSLRERVVGCLLGGALGDALGAPIEMLGMDEIVRRYGPSGIVELDEPARFTDDTQMTLFTCEALVHAEVQLVAEGSCMPPLLLHHAYLHWLATQGVPWDVCGDGGDAPGGWLVGLPVLHHRAAPGLTCLTALESGRIGRIHDPINDSKGCGGVMRSAPTGILTIAAPPGSAPAEAYHLGCESAAVTHGHPDGIHAAGAMAAIVHLLLDGQLLEDAWRVVRPLTTTTIADAVDRAFALAAAGPVTQSVITDELGAGWVADEALAIAVACAAGATSFVDGVRRAVNHGGDSDSTGSICGQLLGSMLGHGALPTTWIQRLEGADVVRSVGDDLAEWIDARDHDRLHEALAARLVDRYCA